METFERQYEKLGPGRKDGFLERNKNKIVITLLITMISMLAVAFILGRLWWPIEVAEVAMVVAAVCFVALFFVPGDKSEEFKDIPYTRIVDRPDYVTSQLSRQIDDMKGD